MSNIPAKNGNGAVFQLSAVTLPDGSQSQAVVLVDSTGTPVTAWPLSQGAATDAKLVEILDKLNASLAVTGPLTDEQLRASAVPVSGTFWQATQPISAAALPLPSNAATASAQGQILSHLQSGSVHVGGAVSVSNLPATQAVSVTSLPLPAGAATETTLAAVRDRLPATPHAQPLTDEQLRTAPVEVTTGCAEDAPATPSTPGFPMLAVRRDSDDATADDGDWAWLKLDEEGRLKVATKPASITPTVGNLAALNSTVVCDARRASNIVFHLKNVGTVTMAAGTFVFEASLDSTNGTDGTWFGIQAARSNANTAATSVAITSLAVNAGDTYAWEASVNGYRWFRVRCSVAATTNSVARWTLQPGSYATEPLPVNQVSTVTATANIGTYGGIVYTDSSANLAISAAFTGTSRDAGSTVGYGVFAANAYADQAGTLYIDKSTDGTTWRPARQVAVAADTPVELKMLITTRYNRVRYVNGAVAQTAFLLTSTMQRI